MRAAGTDDDRFGRELRRLREQAGLTQLQLATRLGYSHTYVSKLESGARVPRIAFAGGADELLGAGGSLVTLATNARARRQQENETVGVPLPRPPVQSEAVYPQPVRRFRLPAYGVICPLHGTDGCTVATAADGLAGLVGGELQSTGTDAVHVLAATLVAAIEADLQGRGGQFLAPLEQTLRATVALVPKVPEPIAMAMLRLAALYADRAAWLRVDRGQRALGMAWLHRGVEWASASRDYAAACSTLSSMSSLALLERDGGTAVAYAQAAAAVSGSRRWIAVQAGLGEFRGYALLGDQREVARLSGEVLRVAERLGDGDRVEAPWLFDAEGATYIASHLAGAMRDLAEATGDRASAIRAVTFAESALANLPAGMPSSRLMLTLRLADSHACGGAMDAAVDLARPVVSAARAAGSVLVDNELDRLRLRLGSHREDLRG
ncbi:helix-turn-helix domain-containing protein [Kribbella sp. NPDC056345]|uniref:helix-turn-helix domain-containing protein n=1 Tax=Kribbella sp. NPDC056345 TaxID=3345789 RepID=UPI0035DC6359